jgi:hypothetical protein
MSPIALQSPPAFEFPADALGSCFQQKDPGLRILTQAIRQNAASRTGVDKHVVIHSLLVELWNWLLTSKLSSYPQPILGYA